jgi:hypothetical protein
MANILDRVPLERISEEAKQVDVGRAVLTAIAAVLFAIGWISGKVFTIVAQILVYVIRGVAWSAVAVKLGWTEARKPRQGLGPAR